MADGVRLWSSRPSLGRPQSSAPIDPDNDLYNLSQSDSRPVVYPHFMLYPYMPIDGQEDPSREMRCIGIYLSTALNWAVILWFMNKVTFTKGCLRSWGGRNGKVCRPPLPYLYYSQPIPHLIWYIDSPSILFLFLFFFADPPWFYFLFALPASQMELPQGFLITA